MLTLIRAGIYTTIQDSGRFLGAHLGISTSGPMDRQSAEIANLILGNDINDALLECTFVGPTIKFHEPTLISIAGATIPAFINEKETDTTNIIQINTDDVLTFGKLEKGCRFYIGIKGGIQSEIIFGSRSTCFTSGILKPLKNGDQLTYESHSEQPTSSIYIQRVLGNTIFKAFKGPEFSILDEFKQNQLLAANYSVLPDSNRMAYRVHHSIDLTHSYSMLSSGTLPGTVQLTPSGDIICLMRDTQTTGGYPRILQLTEESICDLAQLVPNEKFTFRMA